MSLTSKGISCSMQTARIRTSLWLVSTERDLVSFCAYSNEFFASGVLELAEKHEKMHTRLKKFSRVYRLKTDWSHHFYPWSAIRTDFPLRNKSFPKNIIVR